MEEPKELEGLEGLGVSVKSQETLENDIIEKLEEKIKKKEQAVVIKQVKKKLTSVLDDLPSLPIRGGQYLG